MDTSLRQSFPRSGPVRPDGHLRSVPGTGSEGGRRCVGHVRAVGGFSLVEVVVALLILAFGVVGLAGTTAYVVRQVTIADLNTERTAALQSVIEQLRAEDAATLTSGADTIGSFQVSWTVTNNGASSSISVVTIGPGLARDSAGAPMLSSSVPDTFTFLRLN